MTSAPADVLDPVHLDSLDGQNGFVINGINASDYSGSAVSSAGDFNHDGFDDLLIGAPRAYGNGGADSGQTYLICGKPGAWGASVQLSTLDVSTGLTINGEAANDYSGGSVGGGKDINGDGYADIIIGATGADVGGKAYVIYGKAAQPAAPLICLILIVGAMDWSSTACKHMMHLVNPCHRPVMSTATASRT